MTVERDVHEANRQSWNAAVPAHNSHKRDQAAFLRQGGSTVFEEELDLLGPLEGRRLAHLLCNCGQDTLSLAALGAEVLGVDISDEAVAFAADLSRDSSIAARFERADVFDWLERTAAGSERFDTVFTSYGSVMWLSDLDRWSEGVVEVLVPGGTYVAVEFHPLLIMMEADWSLRYPYFGGSGAVQTEGVPDYVAETGEALAPSGFEAGADGFVNPHPDFTYPWSLSEIFTAFLRAGLVLERFEEYPYTNGGYQLESMVRDEKGRFRTPAGMPDVPMMYGIRFRKP